MTDKELLELAAKAAGIRKDDSAYNGGGKDNTGFDIMGNMVLDWHNNERWNPLTDDGDKYRLERDLKMSINRDIGTVRCKGHTESFTVGDNASEAYAIVRAAAEIGKEMK